LAGCQIEGPQLQRKAWPQSGQETIKNCPLQGRGFIYRRSQNYFQKLIIAPGPQPSTPLLARNQLFPKLLGQSQQAPFQLAAMGGEKIPGPPADDPWRRIGGLHLALVDAPRRLEKLPAQGPQLPFQIPEGDGCQLPDGEKAKIP